MLESKRVVERRFESRYVELVVSLGIHHVGLNKNALVLLTVHPEQLVEGFLQLLTDRRRQAY